MAHAFSVLTPSFNQGRFIKRNLLSVRNQDVDDVQHIVVDGRSTDETIDVLRRFASRDCRWISEPDNGQADALNKALAMADGSYVGWLNADEYYEPNILSAVQRAFDKHPDAVVVYGHVRRVLADGTAIRVNYQPRFDYDICRIQAPMIINCGAFFRRDRLIECGGFDPSFHYLMDWEMYIRLMRGRQRWVRLNRVLSNFVMHADSKTATNQAGFEQELRRLRVREFPGLHPQTLERMRQKQVRRMMASMLADGILFEKVYFKLVRQRQYADYFGDPGARLPVISKVLDWVLPAPKS